MAVKITGADRGTPAEQAGLAGATLLSIDGNEINDMLDYEFFSSGPKLELALVRGAKLEYVCVEKDEYAPLGCTFESYLIDKKHSCRNKCMFCFIDQLPSGLRETLYFKDDDERLSFLFGNYITMTNPERPRSGAYQKNAHLAHQHFRAYRGPELRVKMRTNRHAARC